MAEPKLYTCFEAVDCFGKHVYVIYSAKVSDLYDDKVPSRQVFKHEIDIKGLESMGCGVFDSKIVLAGGVVTRDQDKKCRRGIITYDTQRRLVSYADFPPMQGLKIRPLVVEICERLYVLNTSTYSRRRSFEIYYPTHDFWSDMINPYFNRSSGISGNKYIFGRTPFSWFVFGNCLCISTPADKLAKLHHAKQISKYFKSIYNLPLPFHGMATTYLDPRYKDVAVIYLSREGFVEGCRLNVDPSYLAEPEKIFKTEPFEPAGELSSYFADFGNGNFCLSIFDNVNIHVYMFQIDRLPDKKTGALDIELKRYVFRQYRFSDFSFQGTRSLDLLGCFALPTDDRKKRVEEAGLYLERFYYHEECESDDDIPICTTLEPPQKTKHSLEDDSNLAEDDSNLGGEDDWEYDRKDDWEDDDSGNDVGIYDD